MLKNLSAVSIGIIIAASFLSFTYLQNVVDANIRNAMIGEYQDEQILQIESLAQYIESDFTSVTTTLKSIAHSAPIQNFGPGHENSQSFAGAAFDDIDHIVYGLSLIDEQGIILYHTPRGDSRSFVGTDVSSRDYVQATEESRDAFLSQGFEGLDGRFSIVITMPIIDLESGKYEGLMSASVKTAEFFERYSVAHALSPERLTVIDKQGTLLFAADRQNIGMNFLSNDVKDTPPPGTQEANILVQNALRGNPYSMTFTAPESGERFVSTHPIVVNGNHEYSLVASTPTAAIHSQIDQILFDRRVATFILLAAIAGAVAIIIVLLTKSNMILHRAVNNRTKDLESANKELAEKNEQLQMHDKMQKEFINLADHELRTPIQPIIGVASLLEAQFEHDKNNNSDGAASDNSAVKVSKSEIAMIIRNAQRLERLSSDLLMATKIESIGIALNIGTIDLSELVAEAIQDAKRQIRMANSGTEIFYNHKGTIFVDADRHRLLEVISNLLNNATKFAKGGAVNVDVEVIQPDDHNRVVTVKIKDNGPGIHSEIMPRLFTKFASRSVGSEGTGLGLYISRSIVEAHGGRIWGENNKDERGATFAFSLPLKTEISNAEPRNSPRTS